MHKINKEKHFNAFCILFFSTNFFQKNEENKKKHILKLVWLKLIKNHMLKWIPLNIKSFNSQNIIQ